MSQELVERLCRRVLRLKLSKSEGEGAPGMRQQWDCSRSRCTLSGSLSLGCFRVLPRYHRVWGGMWEPLADAECKAVWWKLVVSEILNSSFTAGQGTSV